MSSSQIDFRKELNLISRLLIKLHKELIERQFQKYEKAQGRIEQSGTKLDLLLNHQSFQWLRPLSALIANIDDLTAEKKFNEVVAKETLKNVEILLFSDQTKNFAQDYNPYDPDFPALILLHQEIKQLLQKTSQNHLDS